MENYLYWSDEEYWYLSKHDIKTGLIELSIVKFLLGVELTKLSIFLFHHMSMLGTD